MLPLTLMKHQKQSVKFMAPRAHVFDMSDPGTGKTGVEIIDFATRRRKGGGPAFVSAPKSLLECAWADDFTKFAPDMKISIAYADNRDKAFAVDADVYITNHDAVTQLAKKPPSFWKKFKDGTFITDESTAYKHRTSARSKAAAKIAKNFKYRRLMSGTPTSNGICDLWHQVFILDEGRRLGKSFFAFRASCCTPQQIGPMPNMIKWIDKPNAEAAVSGLLSDIVIRHAFEDCTDIPENHKYPINFTLSATHMALYKELEAASVLYAKQGNITAINGAALFTKLLQLASGAVYNDDDSYTLIDTSRYELVLDLVEARKHSIVFFNWKHQRDELIKLATARGITHSLIDGSVTRKGARQQIVKDYEQGAYQTLFAHPQSAGHGLTLVKGTSTIFASPTANLEHYLQGLKRIHRIGQTEKTETIMVIAPGTREEGVYESLQNKDGRMYNFLDFLKEAA